jgi:hypothetical protein
MQIAGLPSAALDREHRIEQVAYVLRLDPEEWSTMCYRRIKRRDQFDQRSFYGKPISTDDLNYQRPRLCPACLRERSIWWAVWDLALVAACPIHPLPSHQCLSGVQQQTVLAADGRAQMPLRVRLSEFDPRNGRRRCCGDPRFNVNGSSLARYLKESGTPRLAVPLPKRREYAFFLLRHAAARLLLSTDKTENGFRPKDAAICRTNGRSRQEAVGFCRESWRTPRILPLIVARIVSISGNEQYRSLSRSMATTAIDQTQEVPPVR